MSRTSESAIAPQAIITAMIGATYQLRGARSRTSQVSISGT